MRATVQPWFNPEYYAYFWQGLTEVLGRRAVTVGAGDFLPLAEPGYYRPRDTFAFIVEGRKFFISANDHVDVNALALAWADAYGKVNVAADEEDPVLPLGPAFGVRALGPAGSLRIGTDFLRFRPPPGWRHRQLAATLARQRTLLPASAYRAAGEPGATVHGQATHWARHPETAPVRAEFLWAARRVLGPGRVTGGLVAKGGPLPPSLADLAAPPESRADYVRRTAQSLLVFNSPAVHGCLGWKLGEYLALGKAILTTPITHRLPAPLVHGRHWHVADPTPDGLEAAIRAVACDDGYRRELERNARAYYEDHVAPAAMVRRMFAAAGVGV